MASSKLAILFALRYWLLLAQIAFIVAAAFVGVIGSGLDGGGIVQRLLLGLAGLGLRLAGAHILVGCLVLQGGEGVAGTPARTHLLDEGSGELLGIVGLLGIEAQGETAEVAKHHLVAKEQLFAYATGQLGHHGHDVALVILAGVGGHVCCHGREVKDLAVLRLRVSHVAVLGLARLYLAEDKRIRD